MRTSKPFSTISYNSSVFLVDTLNKFIKDRLIDFWAWAKHLPEDDEKKAHKHVFIIPNGRVDTDTLHNRLSLELDVNNLDENGLPRRLGCINFVSSKFSDWYYYVQHDITYLASKGQARKYHYKDDDIIVSDTTYFNELKHTVTPPKSAILSRLKECAENGLSFEQLIYDGLIPVNAVSNYEKVYNVIWNRTYRSGRNGHDEIT